MNRDPGQGWFIVALCFAALALSFTMRSALGLVMPLWEQDFAVSRGFVSAIGAAALIVMGLASPITGHLVDRLGPRGLITAGLGSLALSAFATAAAGQTWQIALGFGLFGALAFGTVANHVAATIVAVRIPRRRGLATGAATAGSTAGQLLLLPLLAVLFGAYGWRGGFAALGIATLALIPLAWAGFGAPRPAAADGFARRPPAIGLTGLARSRVYRILLAAFLLCGFTTSGVVETHLLPYTVFCGFPPLEGATAYGVMAGFNMAGMLAAGWLADRMHRPTLLAAIFFARALSFLLLMEIAGDRSLLFLFAAAFGLLNYAVFPVIASIVASHLGLRVMGLATGILSASHAAGAAAGALAGGVLFDLFARYLWVWAIALVLAALAGLLALAVPDRRAPRPLPA